VRTIRFYSNAKGQTWLSPTRLVSAVCSGEPIRFIDHTTGPAPKFQVAFDGAVKYLRKLVSVGLWKSLFGLMMITGVLGLLKYPVVMGRLPSPIPETLFCIVAVFTLVSLAQIVKLIIRYAHFELRRRKLFKDGLPHIWRALDYEPPPMGQRIKRLTRPKMGWAGAFCIAMVLLNSLVIATPYRPALVGDQVVETFAVVPLGTNWTMVQRYPFATAVSYAFMSGSTVWWVQVDYDAEYIDLTRAPVDFETAMANYVASIGNNVYSYIAQAWGPDATDAVRLADISSWYEDEGNIQMLQLWFRTHFNETFDGVLMIRNVRITFQHGTVQTFLNRRGQ